MTWHSAVVRRSARGQQQLGRAALRPGAHCAVAMLTLETARWPADSFRRAPRTADAQDADTVHRIVTLRTRVHRRLRTAAHPHAHEFAHDFFRSAANWLGFIVLGRHISRWSKEARGSASRRAVGAAHMQQRHGRRRWYVQLADSACWLHSRDTPLLSMALPAVLQQYCDRGVLHFIRFADRWWPFASLVSLFVDLV